ncbi:uncharacterized protein LOC134716041 isoform X2 [Mytilus trossulus]|uniref:uncharacterized protein LOC134716041 isoform X2 n=1 Tax=Mytilus trossulus TaxID=6551 RepID=UPI003004AA58
MTNKAASLEKTLISMCETTNSNAFDFDFESATDNINNQKEKDVEKANKSTKLEPVELTAVETQFLAEKNSDFEVEVSLRSQSQGTKFKTSIVEDERQHECSEQDNIKAIATGVCDSKKVAPSDLEPVDGKNVYSESSFDEELSKLNELNDEIEKMFKKETYHIEEKADTFSKEKPNAIDTDIQRSFESAEYNPDESKKVDKTSCVRESVEILNNEDALPNENMSSSYDPNINTNVSQEQYTSETEGKCEAQDKDIFEIKSETNRECEAVANRDDISAELKHLTEECSQPFISFRQSRESSKTVQNCVPNTISFETDSNIKPSSQITSTSANELETDKNDIGDEPTCVYNYVNEKDNEHELIDECFINKQTGLSKTQTGINALLKLSDKDLEQNNDTMNMEGEEDDTSVNNSLDGSEELKNKQRNEAEAHAHTSNTTSIKKTSNKFAKYFGNFQSNDTLTKNTYEGDDKLSTINVPFDAIDKQNKVCIDIETSTDQKAEVSIHSKSQVTVFNFEAISSRHVESDKKEKRKIIKIKAGRSPTKQVSNSSQSTTTGLNNFTHVGSEVTSFPNLDDQRNHVKELHSKFLCESHHEVWKFWCMDCKKSRCEKCINIFSKEICINHQLKSLKLIVSKKKKKQKTEIQRDSKNCLQILDQAFQELQQNEQESQFQALIQRERIHQEFISFHHLLIDEENKILKHLDKTLDEHSLQNSEGQKKYGSLIDAEASLMCESLSYIDKDDSFETNFSVVTSLAHAQVKLKKLGNEATHLLCSIQPIPSAINQLFSLNQQKSEISAHLEYVEDPFQLCTVGSTMFMDDEFIVAPIQVSDLFLYANSRRTFSEIFLYIELICDKKVIFKKVLNMTDYVFNYYGGYYLHPYRRYLVKAKRVTSNEMDQVKADRSTDRYKHILIVTGKGPRTTYSMHSEARVLNFIANTDCSQRQTCRRIINTYRRNRTRVFWNIGFLLWRQSKMWPFSAVEGCKDLYDISPEEMRSLAYRLDRSSYVSLENELSDTFDVMCSNDEKELLDNLNLMYQIEKIDTTTNANVKLDIEMKTVQHQEMETQRESFNAQLASLKEEIDSKQHSIDQLKQENEKLSVANVKLNEDTCKKKHNELESAMMTGISSLIHNDEVEERDLACFEKSTSQMDEKDDKKDDVDKFRHL